MTKTTERAPDSNIVALTNDPFKAAAEAIASTTEDVETAETSEYLVIKGKAVNMGLLWSILSYRRGHGSVGEKEFIKDVLFPMFESSGRTWNAIGPANTNNAPLNPDLLNFAVIVPKADGKMSETLFSCHIDTVHSTSDQRTKQVLNIDPNFDQVFLSQTDKANSACLGADNGAGVWLLLEMIRYEVPGVYVFHRGEERGCVGSNWIADNRKDWLRGFKRAVAFDRKDTNEVITHQRGQRCCSDDFAMALATELSKKNLTYKPSPEGMYTDTASYKSLIPECTNIGVGYESAHGSGETLDYGHLQNLLEACVAIDWETLPTKRDPKVVEYRNYNNTNTGVGGYSGGYGYGRGYQGGHYNGHRSGYRSSDDDTEAFWTARSSVGKAATDANKSATQAAAQSSDTKGGKKNKKNQAKQAAATRPGSLFDMDSSMFADMGTEDIFEYIASLGADEATILVMALLEEIEGLKSRLAFVKKAGGFY